MRLIRPSPVALNRLAPSHPPRIARSYAALADCAFTYYFIDQVEPRFFGNDALEGRGSEQEPHRGLQEILTRKKRYVIRKKRWRHNTLTWRLDRSHVKDEDEFVVSDSVNTAAGQSPSPLAQVEPWFFGNDALKGRGSEQEPHRRLQEILTRKKRYVIRKKRWRHNTLTWRLDRSHVKDEDEFVVRTTLHRAFQEWSSAASVRFEEVFEEPADITIGFERGKHEDAFPFDGKDGIVAHAFYPRDGRLHFDADEDWSLNSPTGVNLYQTAVHEIGHILGLEHSVDPRAVMYAARRPYNPDFALGGLR
ncbi:Matrixin [Oesophagostomum dentatum]|uniref:Matrixin n=1 Tax=Oesophagostomum dentatum TaxID=61180 RepID=A0A0B1TJ41_OESDE|nr:Matrixin [Oesophagostomum dentatum]